MSLAEALEGTLVAMLDMSGLAATGIETKKKQWFDGSARELQVAFTVCKKQCSMSVEDMGLCLLATSEKGASKT